VRSRVAASALAAFALLAAVAGPAAAADYHAPTVKWVQPTVVAHSDGTATVHVKYTCWGGDQGTHLFIGLKQGAEIDVAEHSTSEFADTFYSTNWNSDGPGLSLHCNGRLQNALFTLKPDPYWAGAGTAAPFHKGIALVQVCIFDSTNSGAEDDLNGTVFDYTMHKIVVD